MVPKNGQGSPFWPQNGGQHGTGTYVRPPWPKIGGRWVFICYTISMAFFHRTSINSSGCSTLSWGKYEALNQLEPQNFNLLKRGKSFGPIIYLKISTQMITTAANTIKLMTTMNMAVIQPCLIGPSHIFLELQMFLKTKRKREKSNFPCG